MKCKDCKYFELDVNTGKYELFEKEVGEVGICNNKKLSTDEDSTRSGVPVSGLWAFSWDVGILQIHKDFGCIHFEKK